MVRESQYLRQYCPHQLFLQNIIFVICLQAKHFFIWGLMGWLGDDLSGISKFQFIVLFDLFIFFYFWNSIFSWDFSQGGVTFYPHSILNWSGIYQLVNLDILYYFCQDIHHNSFGGYWLVYPAWKCSNIHINKYICCHCIHSTMAPFIHCDINQASMGAGPVVGNRSQRSSEDPCRTIARAPVAGCSPKNWLQSSVNPFCPWRQVLRLLHWMHQQMGTKQVIKGRGKITCKGLQSLQYCNNIVSFQGVFFYFALWVTRFAWAVLILNHVLWDSCWVTWVGSKSQKVVLRTGSFYH